ncbi:MAG TPA: DNA mismatch repair protein MutS, partial [Clostridia bacterium]|nr:DNA mismatch repair protein MutS [Clostridia bacterium]
EVGVQIQKKKEFINHKRLQLKVAAEEMYPEDYDFSIIFDSVANRKARKKMSKGYRPDLEIIYEKEQL